jgi:hypothetical protein
MTTNALFNFLSDSARIGLFVFVNYLTVIGPTHADNTQGFLFPMPWYGRAVFIGVTAIAVVAAIILVVLDPG